MMKVMRRICVLILLVMMSFFNVSAKEGVSITSIQCSNMTDGKVKENMDVKVNGLNIDVEDTVFGTVGDYMKCSLEISNNSNDTATVNETSISNLSNDYIQYELLSDTKEIKKGQTAKYNLNINYKKEYKEDKTIDNVVNIGLVSDNVKNPNTSSTNIAFIGFILAVLVFIGMKVLRKKKKLNMLMLLFTLGIVTIPSVRALTLVKITLNNRIIVETEKYHVYYMVSTFITEEEKSNYLLTDKFCKAKPIYFEDDSSKTPYFRCNGILKDLGSYRPNAQVKLTDFEYLWGYTTEYETYVSCPTKDVGVDTTWEYKRKYNKDYQESDMEVMNFESVLSNNWEGSGSFIFFTPNTFTMPSHDVYFAPKVAY